MAVVATIRSYIGCPMFHDWDQWQMYQVETMDYGLRLAPREVGIPGIEIRQRRHCRSCGKWQDEKVR